MRKEKPTEEEAIAFIQKWPDMDIYIDANTKSEWTARDEPTDNSLDLERYWKLCKSIAEHGHNPD